MTAKGERYKVESKKPPQGGKTDDVAASERIRGKVQTVRMDEVLVRALKQAAIDRNTSQQDIILQAIRRDLGLGQER